MIHISMTYSGKMFWMFKIQLTECDIAVAIYRKLNFIQYFIKIVKLNLFLSSNNMYLSYKMNIKIGISGTKEKRRVIRYISGYIISSTKTRVIPNTLILVFKIAIELL